MQDIRVCMCIYFYFYFYIYIYISLSIYIHTYMYMRHSVQDEPDSCWHALTGNAASSEGRRRLSFGQDLSNACDGRLVEPPSSIIRFGQKG